MRSLFLAATLLTATTLSAQSPSSIASDPPVDQKRPAALVEIAVPSHGVQLLGALYLAAGAGPHPTVILYHGFPGYEQNLDLAQALRRAGYNVLAVHYRGSWGVKGDFSFTHVIEDADAQVDWITSPEIAAKYRVDTTRIILIGHSMGGFAAISATAHNPKVRAAVLISAASLGHRFAELKPEDKDKAVGLYVSKVDPADVLPLAGTTPAALGAEIFDHRGVGLYHASSRDWKAPNSAHHGGRWHWPKQRSIASGFETRRKHGIRTYPNQNGSPLQRPPHRSRNRHYPLARSAGVLKSRRTEISARTTQKKALEVGTYNFARQGRCPDGQSLGFEITSRDRAIRRAWLESLQQP